MLCGSRYTPASARCHAAANVPITQRPSSHETHYRASFAWVCRPSYTQSCAPKSHRYSNSSSAFPRQVPAVRVLVSRSSSSPPYDCALPLHLPRDGQPADVRTPRYMNVFAAHCTPAMQLTLVLLRANPEVTHINHYASLRRCFLYG